MKVVYQGKTKKGKEIIIRYPEKGDERRLWEYVNKLSKEKTYISLQGEKISLKEELKYLGNQLKTIENKKCVHLFVFCNDELISASDVHMKEKTEKHIGIFGIAILKDFRGEGIGKLLMELVLKEAEKELPDLKVVTLEVYETNSIAQNLYREFGFVEYGRLPNGITRNNSFEDGLFMYKNLR